jgi:hypothetical protein
MQASPAIAPNVAELQKISLDSSQERVTVIKGLVTQILVG